MSRLHRLVIETLLLSCGALCASAAPTARSNEASLANLERVMVTTPPRAIEDFELVSHEGRSLRLSALRGRPLLLFFGFTRCPEVCPTALSQLKSVKESEPRKLRDLRVVFISVDGNRDDPGALKAYLQHFSRDFIGLTGTPAQVREIGEEFAVAIFKGKAAKGTKDYPIEHTNRVYALDRYGRLRAELYDAETAVMKEVARMLLAER